MDYTDYDALIKALRHCAKQSVCNGCPRCGKRIKNCNAELDREAADAIEELVMVANAIPNECKYCVGCEVEKQNGGCDTGFILSPERAKHAIESCTPRWIPVTERFPEKYHYAAVWVKDEMNQRGFYGIGSLSRSGDWYVDGDDYSENSNLHVTHWMPLPAPPKEETE